MVTWGPGPRDPSPDFTTVCPHPPMQLWLEAPAPNQVVSFSTYSTSSSIVPVHAQTRWLKTPSVHKQAGMFR